MDRFVRRGDPGGCPGDPGGDPGGCPGGLGLHPGGCPKRCPGGPQGGGRLQLMWELDPPLATRAHLHSTRWPTYLHSAATSRPEHHCV